MELVVDPARRSEVAALGCRRPLVLASRRSRAMPAYAGLLASLAGAEVAAALGIPAGTVASRLHRARKQLRKALGDVNPLEETHG